MRVIIAPLPCLVRWTKARLGSLNPTIFAYCDPTESQGGSFGNANLRCGPLFLLVDSNRYLILRLAVYKPLVPFANRRRLTTAAAAPRGGSGGRGPSP